MVVRAEVCVTEIARRFREREQVVERALLAHERDQRKVDTELHSATCHESLYVAGRSARHTRSARSSASIRKSSRHSPGGGLNAAQVAADSHGDEHLAAAGERDRRRRRLDRLVAAGEGCGPARAQRQRPPDQVELRRHARPSSNRRRSSQSTGRRLSGSTSARQRARRPDRCRGRRVTVSLSRVVPSTIRSARSANRSANAPSSSSASRPAAARLRARLPRRAPARASSCSPSPRAAPSRGSARAARRSAATRRRASAGSGTPRSDRASRRCGAGRAPPTRPGHSEIAARRARTSPLRLVSCVVVASRPRGAPAQVRVVELGDREREARRDRRRPRSARRSRFQR